MFQGLRFLEFLGLLGFDALLSLVFGVLVNSGSGFSKIGLGSEPSGFGQLRLRDGFRGL